MENKNFNVGDVVFHKANNLQMVVIATKDSNNIQCKYEDVSGKFQVGYFADYEITYTSGVPNKLNMGPIKD